MENSQVQEHPFGDTLNGNAISLFTLQGKGGAKVTITNYGGIITSIKVPDKMGDLGEIVLGYDDIKGYFNNPAFFGAIIGRFGNRISRGKFAIDGQEYQLACNLGDHHLHGGAIGFNQRVWTATIIEDSIPKLKLTYLSPDGEEGYPGNVAVTVIYSLTDENALVIDYQATTDKDTPINLTNHSYFNLNDGGQSPITDHILQLNANAITEVDSALIPTGRLLAVDQTPFDFRNAKPIGKDIGDLQNGGGYDHNFVVQEPQSSPQLIATVNAPKSGRVMEVWTTEPAVQLYTADGMDRRGRGGIRYGSRHGFCLETQHSPDSPNRPEFPSTILQVGKEYKSTTIYKFDVR